MDANEQEQNSKPPLSEYALGQWWLDELKEASITRSISADLVRACGVAVNLANIVLAPQHPDDEAVDRFAAAMKAKLAAAREKGRGGWNDPTVCSPEMLAEQLVMHLMKTNSGTFEDVANFAMMLHQINAPTDVLAKAMHFWNGIPSSDWEQAVTELCSEGIGLELYRSFAQRAYQIAGTQEQREARTQGHYEHCLAYSGLPDSPWLRYMYFHGANHGIPAPEGETPLDFREWWLKPEQAKLRASCAEGWGYYVWRQARASMEGQLTDEQRHLMKLLYELAPTPWVVHKANKDSPTYAACLGGAPSFKPAVIMPIKLEVSKNELGWPLADLIVGAVNHLRGLMGRQSQETLITALGSARARLVDMLEGDDGQAWKEAEKEVQHITQLLEKMEKLV